MEFELLFFYSLELNSSSIWIRYVNSDRLNTQIDRWSIYRVEKICFFFLYNLCNFLLIAFKRNTLQSFIEMFSSENIFKIDCIKIL